MASVRKKGRYSEDDTLGEFLLNQVTKFVKYGQLGPLSRDLRISQTDYEKITAPNYLQQTDQIFKVLDNWRQRLPLEYNVRSFIDNVICWHREGYLDTDDWNHLQNYIEPQLLPQIAVPSGGTAGQSSGYGASCILITGKGEPGCGKTCSMAMLAMDWAEGKAPSELQQFEFVFLIDLKNVHKNIPLEEIILQQHGRMRNMGVSKEQIKSFIQKKKVLILLDGYDEYWKGTNTDIDSAITDTLGDCFILVTSRPEDYMKKPDRDQMDGEVQITGFSDEAVKECSTKYLGNEERSKDFQYKCWESGIRELLRIPIVLLMLCVLYHANETLPKRKTDIVFGIIKMYINRAKKRFPRIKDVEHIMYKLGELSWKALQRKTKQLLISKDDVCKMGQDILKLGLLFGSLEGEEASVDEQPEWLTFAHKLFQDFAAGFYIGKTKEPLESLLPSWNDIEDHREIVLFAVGLMSDPTPRLDHVYQMLINNELQQLRMELYYYPWRYHHNLLKSLYTESQVQLPGQPLHNQHINYYQQLDDDTDNRPIYSPSKIYEFENIKNDIVLGIEQREQEGEILECALIIKPSHSYKAQSVLYNCQVIMRNQAINNLFMKGVKATDLPQTYMFNISKHIQSLTLKWCKFPSKTLNHLMEQINKCSTLRKIDLHCTTIQSVSSLTLKNKTSLTHLDLGETNMSRELRGSVCHQLIDLTQLEHLDLSQNDLSHVDMIHLSNKPKLSYLNCCDTQMSTKLSKNVMGQLEYITHLSELNLSNNTLTGCLTSFVTDHNPGLPELDILILMSTSLNNDDLQNLTHLIQTHKLPGLKILTLSFNRFCEMETDVEHLIEACLNDKRELKLFMWHSYLSDALREKLKHRCLLTTITLSFAINDRVI